MAKRRISVLVLSPDEKRILVSRRTGRWEIPDSVVHWPGGKRMKGPKATAESLVQMSMHGVTDPKLVKEWIKQSRRHVLPTGGFAYTVSADIDETVRIANRVNKFMKLDKPILEMHDIDEVADSFGKYGGSTIEAVRSLAPY
jgi:hypothetical protein